MSDTVDYKKRSAELVSIINLLSIDLAMIAKPETEDKNAYLNHALDLLKLNKHLFKIDSDQEGKRELLIRFSAYLEFEWNAAEIDISIIDEFLNLKKENKY